MATNFVPIISWYLLVQKRWNNVWKLFKVNDVIDVVLVSLLLTLKRFHSYDVVFIAK